MYVFVCVYGCKCVYPHVCVCNVLCVSNADIVCVCVRVKLTAAEGLGHWSHATVLCTTLGTSSLQLVR